MNIFDTVSAERSGSTERARNLVRQQTIAEAEFDWESLRARRPANGYTTPTPSISALNSATREEIFGAIDLAGARAMRKDSSYYFFGRDNICGLYHVPSSELAEMPFT